MASSFLIEESLGRAQVSTNIECGSESLFCYKVELLVSTSAGITSGSTDNRVEQTRACELNIDERAKDCDAVHFGFVKRERSSGNTFVSVTHDCGKVVVESKPVSCFRIVKWKLCKAKSGNSLKLGGANLVNVEVDRDGRAAATAFALSCETRRGCGERDAY